MIFTFYSYKGGVGRSMALANVADILARDGLRVLMIDFDLEAPGLEQFFAIDRAKALRHLGLLDLLASYKQAMARDPEDEPASDETPAFKRLREHFIVPVYPDLPSRGRLDLLPAGRRGSEDEIARYALELRTFDWQDFYFKWGGELFFEWLRRALVPELYDVVLVDSRTGVTEMGGICAYQLADAVIMLCAANRQNVDGILSVVRNFSSPRVRELRRGRLPRIVVVPARVENSDGELRRDFHQRFTQAFDAHTPKALSDTGMSFWDLLIPYDPSYAFAEQVIAEPGRGPIHRPAAGPYLRLVEALGLLAEPGSKLHQLYRGSTSRSLGHEAIDVSHGGAPLLDPDIVADGDVPPYDRGDETSGADVSYGVPQYDITRQTAAYDAYLSAATTELADAEAIEKRLADAGLRTFIPERRFVRGMSWLEAVEEAIKNSHAFVVLIGPKGLSTYQDDELRYAIEVQAQRADFRFLPVLLPGTDPAIREQLPHWLRQLSWIELPASLEDATALDELVEAVRGRRPRPAQAESQLAETAPYPGLTPFGEEDAAYFFGRRALIADMLDHLTDRRCLFVVGPSGCGKSSLVFAGLVPALRRGVAGSEGWRFLILRPGGRPVRRLASGLTELDGEDGPPLEQIEEALLRDPQALLEQVLRRGFSGPERRLVLIVDQFEELWTVGREREEGEIFCHQLATAVSDPESPLILIVTLRADFTHRALSLPNDFAALLNQHLVLVPPMSRAELREAIEEPARRAGLAFEPGLIEAILNDIGQAPGALPLLQASLFRLWEKRQSGFLTHEAYLHTGDVTGALAQTAEEIFVALDGDEQDIARSILLRLVQPGSDGAPDTRRRASFGELFTSQGSTETVERIIEQLNNARLVIVSRDARGAALELAHEALIPNWPRLREWIDDEREWLRQRRRLAVMAQDWEAGGRDEGFLLRGAPLHELAAASRDRSLSQLEEHLLEASLAREAQAARQEAAGRRRRMLATAAFVVVTLVFTVLSVVWKQSSERTVELAQQRATTTFSPDRRFNAFVLDENILRLQPLAPPYIGSDVSLPAAITTIEVSPDSRFVVAGGSDGSLTVLDTETGEVLLSTRAHSTPLRLLAFSSDASALATAGEDGGTKIWDLSALRDNTRGEAQPENELSLPGSLVKIAFNANGSQLLATDVDQRTQTCSFATAECVPISKN